MKPLKKLEVPAGVQGQDILKYGFPDPDKDHSTKY